MRAYMDEWGAMNDGPYRLVESAVQQFDVHPTIPVQDHGEPNMVGATPHSGGTAALPRTLRVALLL